MNNVNQGIASVEFMDLESRFGKDNAFTILRTLEQFEGVMETQVARLPFDERLRNVLRLMKENTRFQTCH